MWTDPLPSRVWIPGSRDSPFRIRDTVDAISLALVWSAGWSGHEARKPERPGAPTELPRFDLLIALLDADHRVTRIVTEPSPELMLHPTRSHGPGLAHRVHGVVVLSIAADDPDTFSDPSLFAFLQRHYRADGIRLVDWIVIDFAPDGFRSLRLEGRGKRRVTARHLRAGTCV